MNQKLDELKANIIAIAQIMGDHHQGIWIGDSFSDKPLGVVVYAEEWKLLHEAVKAYEKALKESQNERKE